MHAQGIGLRSYTHADVHVYTYLLDRRVDDARGGDTRQRRRPCAAAKVERPPVVAREQRGLRP